MSHSYERGEGRRRTTTGSYGATGSRSVFGYWIPLAVTVTAATIGLVAWIWSERKEDEEDTSEEEHQPGGIPPPGYASMSGGLPPGPGPGGFQGPPPGFMGGPPQQGGFSGPPAASFTGIPPGQMSGPPLPFQGGGGESAARSTSMDQKDEATLISRVSGALKRTPSPSKSYDWASKKVAAGVAAAGALVEGALSTIREGSQDDYEDHERWSKDAENQANEKAIEPGIKRRGTADEFFSGSVQLPRQTSLRVAKRKTVAIVVSAVEVDGDAETDVDQHASMLSHLPEHINHATTKVFVLIYAPNLKAHPLSPTAAKKHSPSMASSFSNISQGDIHTPALTPGEFPSGVENGILANVEPNPIDESSSLYKTLHNQANAVVEKETMVMPFTSRNGHKHILRSLEPEAVYIQESLCGSEGEVVENLSGWVKQTIVVIGDEGGHGGLIDTDDEGGQTAKGETWWQKEERTGLGKRVTVVESLKVDDDWRRRINEQD